MFPSIRVVMEQPQDASMWSQRANMRSTSQVTKTPRYGGQQDSDEQNRCTTYWGAGGLHSTIAISKANLNANVRDARFTTKWRSTSHAMLPPYGL